MGSITVEPYDPTNFEPVPLPEGLPTYELPKISIGKLLGGDEAEHKAVFDICARTGFFYLNLMDHPLGRKLWENACKARNMGQHVMSTHPDEEKKTFKMRPERGILDRGYSSSGRESKGIAKFVESINIPRDELFAKTTPGWELPGWLKEYEELFREIQTDAHAVEQIILGVLERELLLAPGALTGIHELDAPTYSFLRVLRYPPARLAGDGAGAGGVGDLRERPRVLAHHDVVSVAMLLTWVGGLQIPADGAAMRDSETPADEAAWRWVRPEAGHMIVNLGDAMPVFTNGVLKSGLHRVVTPHGEQAALDRVSVLFTGRPNWAAPMVPFASPRIPPPTAEQAARPVEACKVWGDNVIKAYDLDHLKKGRVQ